MLDSRGGVYYGISWSANRLFVLWRNFKKGEVILVFNSRFELTDEIPLKKCIDGHQILYLDGSLFVTNTAENSLIEVDLETYDQREINFTPYNHDHNHINGLSYLDSRHFWILYANGKIDSPSRINKFSIKEEQVTHSFKIGNQIHNYLCDYVTSSYDFRVFRYRDEEVRQSEELEGWIRGMDFVEDHLVVGSSVISERDKRADKMDGSLYFLGKNLILLDELTVEGIGQINEIRTLSTDYSHNNIIFNGAEEK